jgi:hypothetical protein
VVYNIPTSALLLRGQIKGKGRGMGGGGEEKNIQNYTYTIVS